MKRATTTNVAPWQPSQRDIEKKSKRVQVVEDAQRAIVEALELLSAQKSVKEN